MTTRKQSHLQERNHPPNRQAARTTKRKKPKIREETRGRKGTKIKEKQAISQLISSLSWRIWELVNMDSCLFCKRLFPLPLKSACAENRPGTKKSACTQCNNFSVVFWLVVLPVDVDCSLWLSRAIYALHVLQFQGKADIWNRFPTLSFLFLFIKHLFTT